MLGGRPKPNGSGTDAAGDTGVRTPSANLAAPRSADVDGIMGSGTSGAALGSDSADGGMDGGESEAGEERADSVGDEQHEGSGSVVLLLRRLRSRSAEAAAARNCSSSRLLRRASVLTSAFDAAASAAHVADERATSLEVGEGVDLSECLGRTAQPSFRYGSTRDEQPAASCGCTRRLRTLRLRLRRWRATSREQLQIIVGSRKSTATPTTPSTIVSTRGDAVSASCIWAADI